MLWSPSDKIAHSISCSSILFFLMEKLNYTWVKSDFL